MFYNIPPELKSSISALEADINAVAKKQGEIVTKKWEYSIKAVLIIDSYWNVLHKKAINPVEGVENEYWSLPFLVDNNVLYYSRNLYKDIYNTKLTEKLPRQGILPEGFSFMDLIQELNNKQENL